MLGAAERVGWDFRSSSTTWWPSPARRPGSWGAALGFGLQAGRGLT